MFLFSFAAVAKEKTTQENWQAMEMKDNAAYISTTHNMLTEDNIAYSYRQATTQVPTDDGVLYDHSGDTITTNDNSAYVSSHLQVPNCNRQQPSICDHEI